MPSDTISDFLDWIDELDGVYQDSINGENFEDRRLQDLLHELEFAKPGNEQAKVGRKLANSRKDRRKHKDQRLIVEKIVEFFDVRENRECLKRMKKLLNDQRVVEQYLVNDRHYNVRVEESEEEA